MTTLREAAQMALDALIGARGYIYHNVLDDKSNKYDTAIEALRAALAQPETPYLTGARLFREGKGISFIQTAVRTDADIGEALQGWEDAKTSEEIAQPEQEIEPDLDYVEDDGCPTEKAVLQRFWREHQKQEPVRLQCVTCGTIYADGVPPQVVQPEQEPYCYTWDVWISGGYWEARYGWEPYCGGKRPDHSTEAKPLYTTPPQREWQGLTDEERRKVWNAPENLERPMDFARAIEAKLKEKNT